MVYYYNSSYICPYSIKRMYSMVPEQLPSTMKQLPYCTDILELPYSMSSLDHLPIIADRRKLNESKQETALKRVNSQPHSYCHSTP